MLSAAYDGASSGRPWRRGGKANLCALPGDLEILVFLSDSGCGKLLGYSSSSLWSWF
jgi:hypothetical protein